jgi:hypothetical protein
LLITFFMLTTAFAKPKIMEIVLPEDGGSTDPTIEYPAKRTINLLLSGDNKIYYYVVSERKKRIFCIIKIYSMLQS